MSTFHMRPEAESDLSIQTAVVPVSDPLEFIEHVPVDASGEMSPFRCRGTH